MKLHLTYDQVPEDECCDVFESLDELKTFAVDQLNGSYNMNMNWAELNMELNKNGYYVMVVD